MIATLDDAIFSLILIMGVVSLTVVFFVFMYMVFEFFTHMWTQIREYRLSIREKVHDTGWISPIRRNIYPELESDKILGAMMYKRLYGNRGFNSGSELAGLLDSVSRVENLDVDTECLSKADICLLFNIPNENVTNDQLFSLYGKAIIALKDDDLFFEEDEAKLIAIYGSFINTCN